MTHETITLKQGVSRAPHDSVSTNGEVAVALDLVNDNGNYAHIEDTETLLSLNEGEQCLAIHENDDYKHYILMCDYIEWEDPYGLQSRDNALAWIDSNDPTRTRRFLSDSISTQPAAVAAVGNTLVATTADGMRYFLFRAEDDEYTDLGFRPPMPEIAFGLHSQLRFYPGYTDEENGIIAAPMHHVKIVDNNKIPTPWYKKTASFVPPYEFRTLDPAENSDFNAWSYSYKDRSGSEGTEPVKTEIERITEFAMGGVNAFVKCEGEDKDRFIMPFFVRYAYEFYDGSLMMHSVPVLMIPNSRGPVFALNNSVSGISISVIANVSDDLPGLELDKGQGNDDEHKYGFRGRVYGFASQLYYRLNNAGTTFAQELAKWKDIIVSLNVYVTPGIYRYNQGGSVYGWNDMSGDDDWVSYYGNTGYYNSFSNEKRTNLADAIEQAAKDSWNAYHSDNSKGVMFAPFPSANTSFDDANAFNNAFPGTFRPSRVLSLDYRSKDEMRDAFEKGAQFYKLHSFEFDDLLTMGAMTSDQPLPFPEGRLKALTGMDKMTDDWGSRDTLTANVLYNYNHRLNLGDVTSIVAPPLPPVIQAQDNTISGTGSSVTMRVMLTTSLGQKLTLASPTSTNQRWLPPHFLFFSDKSATKMQTSVTSSPGGHTTTETKSVTLKPHPLLNGAYWLGDIDNPDAFNSVASPDNAPAQASSHPIRERSLVATSNAYNPFTFAVENREGVGDGTILALRSAVAALSEGQFGAHPMYAFTTQGVWSLSPSATGGWNTVQPVTRDVLVSGTEPLSLDTAVIFPTARGIVHLVGSKSTIITRQLEGTIVLPEKLAAFLARGGGHGSLVGAQAAQPDWRNVIAMAYDYRHQRVYVNNADGGSWVLNLRNMQWTQATTKVDFTLNSYPDCEFVSNRQIVTIGDTPKSHGLLLTRPIKTGGEFLAKLRDVDVRSAGVDCIGVFGTRDYNNFAVVGSAEGSRLTRHGGSPYKAHSVVAVTDGETALDHIAVELVPAMRNRYR